MVERQPSPSQQQRDLSKRPLTERTYLEGAAAQGDVGARQALKVAHQYERQAAEYLRREVRARAAQGDAQAKEVLAGERERTRQDSKRWAEAHLERSREIKRRYMREWRARQKQLRAAET